MMKHKNPKLLHILPAYYAAEPSYEMIASWGGGERFAAELALATSRLTPTTLVTFGASNRVLQEQALEIVILKSRPLLKKFNGNTEFFSLPLLNMIRKFDVIHTHQYYTDCTVWAGIIGKLYGKRVFSTDLGFAGVNIARFFPLDKVINRLLCLSEYDTKRLRLPINKVGVIHGGVDLDRYTYHSQKKAKVLFVGRLLPHKGINYLIDAMGPNDHCVIAGHPYNNDYLRYLKQRAKGKRIEFMLSPSDKEVLRQLSEASVLVLPSVDVDYKGKVHKNPELFGLVIAEAFACGTPAIVSDSSALPYVVRDGVDGFVVAQNDPQAIAEKVHYLFDHPEIVKQMGSHARAKAESLFNWDNVAKLAFKYYASDD